MTRAALGYLLVCLFWSLLLGLSIGFDLPVGLVAMFAWFAGEQWRAFAGSFS